MSIKASATTTTVTTIYCVVNNYCGFLGAFSDERNYRWFFTLLSRLHGDF